MTTKTIIKVVGVEVFSTWKTLDDVNALFSEAEMVEMCVRYQASQKHAVAYRERAKVKGKLLKARLEELEARVAAQAQAAEADDEADDEEEAGE